MRVVPVQSVWIEVGSKSLIELRGASNWNARGVWSGATAVERGWLETDLGSRE